LGGRTTDLGDFSLSIEAKRRCEEAFRSLKRTTCRIQQLHQGPAGQVGTRVDVVIGERTIRALEVKIGTRRDGARHLNSHTATAFQKFLNAR